MPATIPGIATVNSFARRQTDALHVNGITVHMEGVIVRSVRHRGLRRLLERDSIRLLKQDLAERVRGIMTALALAENMEAFVTEAPPGWRVHRLSGERQGEWSVSVSSNWRITFEERDGGIERLNLEDYH
ncbi:MAG: type II toxin-antitoxin system RelE/ParE family toxin [Rhodospirillaceae bacterium]|nr:type II toxin-antitoxin system RelE/ParE family toxin [Rhodospirillaceae bacterium]